MQLSGYYSILIFMIVAFGFATLIFSLSWLKGPKKPYKEKLLAYECGFDTLDSQLNNAHAKLDIQYYLIAILFVIFDLEIAFLFPWAVSIIKIGWSGFWSMIIFITIITIGFAYEWRKGALDWR